MKKNILAAFLFACLALTACADKNSSSTADSALESVSSQEAVQDASGEAPQHETAPEQEIGFPGMEAMYPGSVKDGEYDIKVDSSSSMFKITACKLTVSNGAMSAAMTMSGKGYEYLYMGTEEDAASADSSNYIKYEEKDGAHVFTVPVEALNRETDCAAFSKKKQEWYGRKLVFRGDELPEEALNDTSGVSIEAMEYEDGKYTMDVALEGGSGKAYVESPAIITIKDGKATAEIKWSSDKYDYMIVDDQKYDAVIKDGVSTFTIPIADMDKSIHVKADTTAMSVPHEIEYALYFDSSTLIKQ